MPDYIVTDIPLATDARKKHPPTAPPLPGVPPLPAEDPPEPGVLPPVPLLPPVPGVPPSLLEQAGMRRRAMNTMVNMLAFVVIFK